MMRVLLFFTALLFFSSTVQAQAICNASGNLLLYSNYDGGVLNISVDVNIPNIKIGVCTYEPVTINITGPFAGNVTGVRYAGYVSTNNNHCSNSPTTTTITGVSAGITSVNFLPASTLSNPNGYSMIVCNYSCDINSNQGGCNTADQIADYFETTMSATMRYHFTQYGCWSTNPYLMSAGGNCCAGGGGGCNLSISAGPDETICAGNSVALGCAGSNLTCTWSPSAGLSTPNSCSTLASPSSTTTYVVTCTDTAGCSDSDTVTVVVDNGSSLSCQPVGPYCTSDPAVALTGCSPGGGVYSGTGVNSGMFSPSTAGAGTHTITYTFLNGNGCQTTTTFGITVNAGPNASIVAIDSLCKNDQPVALQGSPAGGTFSGPGVSNGIFDPSGVTPGQVTITYTVTSGGCTATASTTTWVNANPAAPAIIFTPPNTLTSSVSASQYQWYLNGSPVSTAGPSILAPAPGTYWLVITENGCSSDTSNHVTVLPNALTDALGNAGGKMYPNPTTGLLTLELPLEVQLHQVTVIDLPGRKVWEKSFNGESKAEAQLQDLPAGAYTVQAHTSKGVFTGKIIISR